MSEAPHWELPDFVSDKIKVEKSLERPLTVDRMQYEKWTYAGPEPLSNDDDIIVAGSATALAHQNRDIYISDYIKTSCTPIGPKYTCNLCKFDLSIRFPKLFYSERMAIQHLAAMHNISKPYRYVDQFWTWDDAAKDPALSAEASDALSGGHGSRVIMPPTRAARCQVRTLESLAERATVAHLREQMKIQKFTLPKGTTQQVVDAAIPWLQPTMVQLMRPALSVFDLFNFHTYSDSGAGKRFFQKKSLQVAHFKNLTGEVLTCRLCFRTIKAFKVYPDVSGSGGRARVRMLAHLYYTHHFEAQLYICRGLCDKMVRLQPFLSGKDAVFHMVGLGFRGSFCYFFRPARAWGPKNSDVKHDSP